MIDASSAVEVPATGEILDFTNVVPHEGLVGLLDEFSDVVSFEFNEKPRGPPIEYGKARSIQ